ncbi:MAG: FHA domain-containing protein [Planctomycetes bacterium]|nr:FHA domain-containing protein [Planctomycetota bacterium]
MNEMNSDGKGGRGDRLGQSIVVGRSRSCDVSTRKSKRFRKASEEEQRAILAARSFLRVSRQHVKITWISRETVEIEDLSRNGTFVDGGRVDRLNLPLPGPDGVEIRLAEVEKFRLL